MAGGLAQVTPIRLIHSYNNQIQKNAIPTQLVTAASQSVICRNAH